MMFGEGLWLDQFFKYTSFYLIYCVTVSVLIIFILLNFFLAIIVESYTAVKDQVHIASSIYTSHACTYIYPKGIEWDFPIYTACR